ncbi:DcrB-related protein, partial [Bacteroides caecigallinarum]|uniref:DcrB-related protein n=1 Tax=Bacteroides caecigallinarum TaxID=1411144 RepID=UPI001F370B40
PTSWQIINEDNQVTNQTNISVQIIEKQKNDYDFSPNINIIVSSNKWKEPTSYLAKQTISQNRRLLNSYHLIEQKNDIVLSNCKGSSIEYTFNMQGYILYGIQYIVKKHDNTTFIITLTVDNNKKIKQNDIINSIINSLVIK